MKEYIEKKIEVVEKKLVNTICDKCGKEIKTESMYDLFKFDFLVEYGTVFPEGGSTTEIRCDLCKDCAIKIIKKLTSEGINFQKKERDY